MCETSVYRATWKGQNKLCQDSWIAPGYTKSRCETFNYQIGLSAKEKLHGFGSKLKDLSEFALLRRINHFCREARAHILSFSNRTLCSLWGTSLYSTKTSFFFFFLANRCITILTLCIYWHLIWIICLFYYTWFCF